MAFQTVFKRHELKYHLTKVQYEHLCNCMEKYMVLDSYGRHKISNVYFDTDNFSIIRHSIEKPKYKEKLRLRVYGNPGEDTVSFIELKKKYNGVVYKRRIQSTQSNAMSYLCSNTELEDNSQIKKEVDYFKNVYNCLSPSIYLSYEREAYYSQDDEHFRITFDFNIKMRDEDVSPYESDYDVKILPEDIVVLEVKTVKGLPFWFVDFLGKNNLYKTSFSKYGTAYQNFILPKYLKSQRGIADAQ